MHMNELAVIHGNVSCAVSRTLHACSYLTKEWEWLRCESQSAPAFGPQTAEILLGAGFVNTENLCNLASLVGKSFPYATLPLRFKNADGSPVRAVAMLED